MNKKNFLQRQILHMEGQDSNLMTHLSVSNTRSYLDPSKNRSQPPKTYSSAFLHPRVR